MKLDYPYLNEILKLKNNDDKVFFFFKNLEIPDICEALENIPVEKATYIFNLFPKKDISLIFKEIDSHSLKKNILNNISLEDIKQYLISPLNASEVVDVIDHLEEESRIEIMKMIKNLDHFKDIIEILGQQKDSAGSLMVKEFVSVEKDWTFSKCLDEIRKQAEGLSNVDRIFVVDNNNKLKGILSLKTFLTKPKTTQVKDIYKKDVISVTVSDDLEKASIVMQKYDLINLPVVNKKKELRGIILIDDIVDFLTDEAEKDYQLASGLTSDVEEKDGFFQSIKARLPWLFIGLLGGVLSGQTIQSFNDVITSNIYLILFIPLIGAMGGNVGIQSSGIVIQGINKNIKINLILKILKESSISLANALFLGIFIFLINTLFHVPFTVTLCVCLSLIIVMINASIIGSVVPFFLNKINIDPALATGPFITTSNDILGVFTYFLISTILLN